jgi:hypothetical protein
MITIARFFPALLSGRPEMWWWTMRRRTMGRTLQMRRTLMIAIRTT